MTMHGEIKVNDIVFAVWGATRSDKYTNEQPNYGCSFVCRDEQGYMNDAVWFMDHTPKTDGPLAPHVIAEGYKRMKRRTYSE